MHVSTVLSRAPAGLDAPLVRVEAHLGPGLPAFFMVGLPEAVVRESKERVRSALLNAGYTFPVGRITVNLSPADLPKEGGRFDLPIAVGILAASGQLTDGCSAHREFYGELALGGELRETPKLLPALRRGSHAGRHLIVPAANAVEASLIGGSKIGLARHLTQVCDALQGGPPLAGAQKQPVPSRPVQPDLGDVRGQYAAKRALEIAAAGCHGLLMIGPPGAGKTLLAQRLPGILPPLGTDDALEVASVESAAGRRPSLGGVRPFRSPQHTASVASLIGGGAFRPGELSLAHLGVLFLDEIAEFPRNALEALREPLESGVVTLCRAKYSYELPARFQLIAAMNPCPCGYAGDPQGRCHCTARQIDRYRRRLSGPLMDRIDIHVEMAALPPEHLLPDALPAESSASVAERVAAAHVVQLARQGKLNARLTPAEAGICKLDRDAKSLLGTAVTRLGLSARAHHRILNVARTIADLAGVPHIRSIDLSEAVQLRNFDRATC